MFLKNKNIIFKTRRSKATDYAALRIEKFFFCVSLRYEMSGKLHLICVHANFRCNLNDISDRRYVIFNSYNYNFFRYSFS